MKIVITGARGFIGSNLARHLIQKGHDVVGLGRSPDGPGYARLDLATGAVGSSPSELVELLAGAEGILHLAAKQVDNLNAPLADYIPSNIDLTEAICRSADQNSLRKMVFASSRLVYPGWIQEDVPETCQDAPDTTYGLSKKMAEQVINFYSHKHRWTGISLRLGQVFGPDPRNRGAVARFIQQAQEQGQVTVFGHGVAVRDFVYIKDVISAFEAALETDAPSGAYNVGSGCGYSIRELAQTVSGVVLGKKNSLIYKSVEIEDISRYVMKCSKAFKYFEWKSKWSLKKSILDML